MAIIYRDGDWSVEATAGGLLSVRLPNGSSIPTVLDGIEVGPVEDPKALALMAERGIKPDSRVALTRAGRLVCLAPAAAAAAIRAAVASHGKAAPPRPGQLVADLQRSLRSREVARDPAAAFDRLYNEGAEGFNPYRDTDALGDDRTPYHKPDCE